MNKGLKYMVLFLFAAAAFNGSMTTDGYAMHELFESIDANEDGRIDEEEFSEDMKEQIFESIDTDRDEMISEDEWERFADVKDEQNPDDIFKKADKDKDSRINFFEFSDYADRHSNLHEAFIGLDKDGSNSLTPDEISVRPMFKMLTIKF